MNEVPRDTALSINAWCTLPRIVCSSCQMGIHADSCRMGNCCSNGMGSYFDIDMDSHS